MTRPVGEVDGVGCLLLLVAYVFTWVSYEMYHGMRVEQWWSAPFWLYMIASLGAAFLSGTFIKAALKK